MSANFLREIDQRNALYGQYKYQVRTSRMKDPAFKIKDWCSKTFGPEADGISFRSYNPQWRTQRRTRWGSPYIYLASDAEATLFNLRWAEAD